MNQVPAKERFFREKDSDVLVGTERRRGAGLYGGGRNAAGCTELKDEIFEKKEWHWTIGVPLLGDWPPCGRRGAGLSNSSLKRKRFR